VLRRWLPWIVIGAAVALLVAPLDPVLVERWYSTRAYLHWQPRLTDRGMAFTPELPHAVQACADDADFPAARLAPYLTPAGKQAMAAFLAQVKLLPPAGTGGKAH